MPEEKISLNKKEEGTNIKTFEIVSESVQKKEEEEEQKRNSNEIDEWD